MMKCHQVLESTSHVIPPKQKGAIKPTAAQARILKTAAPTAKQLRHNLDPTPAASVHEETAVLPLEALFSQPGDDLTHFHGLHSISHSYDKIYFRLLSHQSLYS